MSEPRQKPGRSRQDYGTPPEFLQAVKKKLGIQRFDCDIAASPQNAVASLFMTAENSAFAVKSWKFGRGWNWLNPEFTDITPWVKRTNEEAYVRNVRTAVLIPAGVGSNWWRDHVHGKCRVLFLNGRLTFVGCTDPYPKDCALLLYDYYSMRYASLYDVWTWKPAKTMDARIAPVDEGKACGSARKEIEGGTAR